MRHKAVVLAALVLLFAGSGAVAQDAAKATEKQLKETQEQMREAERKLREAERQMREAQRQLNDAARRMAEIEVQRSAKEIDARVRMELKAREAGRDRVHTVWFGRRARLGVVVNTEADRNTDALGASLKAVTPGGPADEAGLKAGDIITKFNGERLSGQVNADEDEDESEPGLKLIQMAAELEDGQQVTVEYRRGKETKTATIVARPLAPHAYKFFADPDLDIDVDIDPDVAWAVPELRVLTLPSRWLDLELVELDRGLGEYFGATEGVLVVHAPDDPALKLVAGDVILRIDDREVRRPAQALRILRGCEAGDEVAIEILRKRERMTLSVHIPERKVGTLFLPRAPRPAPAPEPPVPPEREQQL